jgi:hypothetical protein
MDMGGFPDLFDPFGGPGTPPSPPHLLVTAAWLDQVKPGDWIIFASERDVPARRVLSIRRHSSGVLIGSDEFDVGLVILGICVDRDGRQQHFSGHAYTPVFIGQPALDDAEAI